MNNRAILKIWPVWSKETVSHAKVELFFPDDYFQYGDKIVEFVDEIYGMPGNIDWNTFVLVDEEEREISYKIEQKTIQHKKLREILLSADTSAGIRIKYEARFLPARTNPVMDMGQEEGGITGTGYCWLPQLRKREYQLTADFYKDQMPEDARLLWGYGEQHTECSVFEDSLQNVFYCFGKVNSVEKDNFGYYWFRRNGYDASKIGEWTRDTFLQMAKFFRDDGENYKIFSRARSCKHSGGVAANRSYSYIYDPENLPKFEELKFLFSHEMIHNWVHLLDEPYGTCTWYVEGMAEFYCLILPWRFGLVTRDELKKELQDKITQYYENPCSKEINIKLGNLLFHDLEATTVPYGRGLVYLMATDKRIRQATNNEKSLDDVMYNLMRKFAVDNTLKNKAWIDAVWEEGRIDETEFLLKMCQGEIIEPELSCFEFANFVITSKNTFARRSLEPCVSYVIE